MNRTILDLCGGTGAWSRPYRDAGYNVTIVDPLAGDGECNQTVAWFLDRMRKGHVTTRLHGILAAPPCTYFSGSGARWFHEPSNPDPDGPPKGPERYAALEDAKQIVRDCLAIIKIANPNFWALENPTGTMRRLVPEVGPVRLQFDPCDYGDPYTKRTQLFGDFNADLKKNKVAITHAKGSSPIHRAPPSPDRWRFRSETPPGFASAFFNANA